MPYDKETLFAALKAKVADIGAKIEEGKRIVRDFGIRPLSDIRKMENQDEKYLFLNLRATAEQRLTELESLSRSPFFVRCDIVSERTGKARMLYFAKHPFIEEKVYSWIAPVAAVRFESPGKVSYRLPNGTIEHATLVRKEQYMIVDGKILFFSIESIDQARELIYQEHFSGKKQGFMLPEIVSIMEKAQDQIIRAHHKGLFAISGPAGSGKTTLALHRVAYLAQSPESAALYPESSVIVFVQDNGTKDYFLHLLPELGIKNVRIVTFFEWASEILGLGERVFNPHADNFEEWKKIQALRSGKPVEVSPGALLSRADTTALLSAHAKKHKKLEVVHERLSYKKGAYKEVKRRERLKYSLMVVDEFQNYLPEQLKLMLSCVDPDTRSTVFVGDMAQQVYPGTIRSWGDIGESIPAERAVRLHKVYRNTRQILEYIRSRGYSVEIPQGIREGVNVIEKELSEDAIRDYIEKVVEAKSGSVIGLIFADPRLAHEYKQRYRGKEGIHAATMVETQGVEFDVTCVVGEPQASLNEVPSEYSEEWKRISRDLLYVALTRAKNEMHVVGIR